MSIILQCRFEYLLRRSVDFLSDLSNSNIKEIHTYYRFTAVVMEKDFVLMAYRVSMSAVMSYDIIVVERKPETGHVCIMDEKNKTQFGWHSLFCMRCSI